MAKEDIEKLREKVEKDPLSKLFVPLAEEYRKAGMLDEAISVLLKGLENQPNYITARVALGKIYLEKKMLKEARDEFKKVIAAIPDNLFALKKVAEISSKLGEIQEAIDAYSKIIKLNPLDEEAKSNLEILKAKKLEEKLEPLASRLIEPPKPEKSIESGNEETEDLEGFMPLSKTSYSEEEFEKFKEEFFIEPPEMEIEEITPVEELQPEPEIISKGPEMPEIDFSYPDRLIEEGNYSKAIEVYKRMLSEHPEDRRIMQRLEELKAFLKILGKDKEVITQQLVNFLEAIKKRKDELLRNP